MRLLPQFRQLSDSFIDVFYPKTCSICSNSLYLSENHICVACAYDLPYIVQSEIVLQNLQKLFWNRVKVEHVFALLNYQKGNQVQRLLHLLKYQQRKRLGEYYGEILGASLPKDLGIDLIIPVPLHPKKLHQRGFNQSSTIAKGISAVMQIPVDEKVMVRNLYNLSQTKFTKYDRWENVRTIFSVIDEHKLRNKHVLLIDDVLTTGATIEACAKELVKIENCTVSIATLAARV
jgi:ComF family protein